MKLNEKSLLIFASSQVVLGARHAIICDLDYGVWLTLSHFEASALETMNGQTKKVLYADNSSRNLVRKLVKNDFATFVPLFIDSGFRKLSTEFETPSIISNCVLFVTNPDYDLNFVLRNLEAVRCQYILAVTNANILPSVLSKVEDSNIIGFELQLDYESLQEETFQHLEEYSKKSLKLIKTIIYNATGIVIVVTQATTALACGIVNADYFAPNIPHFTEAQQHNTCLNRKVAIDAEGNIRNCPSLPEVYGNIMTDDLKEVVSRPEFQKYWNIKKDDITKCKDCEFRYICTDCRAYRENPDDLYSAPLKCGYDPYTGVWEEWSTNPLKQKAIKYYGMQELVEERQQRLKKNE
jgi:SPASM domain peptide maturase of grasp-with-spasm system